MSQLPDRVVLIGPSGSGKSSLAVSLAAELGYSIVDCDDAIVERIGMPIGEFFTRFGEPAFRAIEEEAVRDACQLQQVVISTGGGAVLSAANWAEWRPKSVIVSLRAKPETLLDRIRQQAEAAGDPAERPMLRGNAAERMQAMLTERGPLYAAGDVSIDTDGLSPAEVRVQAVSEIRRFASLGAIPKLSLATSTGRSDIYVANGLAAGAGELAAQRWPKVRRIWLISDENIAPVWAEWLAATFREVDRDVRVLTVAAGETSKEMAVVERLCAEMTSGGVTRRDLVVALGGGVVGDLAGFVASVCLRGLALMQVPTSLLAMVDSSVGGKTGVNMPAGKNLVGAFYQPGVVLVDPQFLDTLPQAEYRSGMAEIIKHGLIQPSTPLGGRDLGEMLAANPLDPFPRDQVVAMLTRNVATKHSVVRADERESGLRMILNYGHTAGHAIEADGYRYRHGEAIGLGLIVASRIAHGLGRVDAGYVETVMAAIARAGLPTHLDGHNGEAIIGRLSYDKKNVDGALRWILPRSDGIVEPVIDVSREIVREALMATGAG